MPSSDSDYNRGFADGLQLVVDCLRKAATQVEATQYGDFSRPGGDGHVVRAITRVGQSYFAKQLREVARTIEETIEDTK